MGILRNIFDGQSPSPDSVSFDASRYEYKGVQEEAKVWHTSDGDGLGIYFFRKAPNIPHGLASVSQLRESYSSWLEEKFRIIECKVVPVDEVPAVWLIAGGLTQQNGGAVFVGSITVPFHDFSYVIKMQAYERGVTGMREAMLVANALKNGTGSVQDGKFVPHNWSVDDEQFDHILPNHPLSRLRRELRAIAGSVKIDEKVKRATPFDLPSDNA